MTRVYYNAEFNKIWLEEDLNDGWILIVKNYGTEFWSRLVEKRERGEKFLKEEIKSGRVAYLGEL